MSYKVKARRAFREWLDQLRETSPREHKKVLRVIRLLTIVGRELGYPHSSVLRGSRHRLRELRPARGRSPYRVIYGIDTRDQAVILIGGSKAGNERAWYAREVPRADALWEAHLASLEQG